MCTFVMMPPRLLKPRGMTSRPATLTCLRSTFQNVLGQSVRQSVCQYDVEGHLEYLCDQDASFTAQKLVHHMHPPTNQLPEIRFIRNQQMDTF